MDSVISRYRDGLYVQRKTSKTSDYVSLKASDRNHVRSRWNHSRVDSGCEVLSGLKRIKEHSDISFVGGRGAFGHSGLSVQQINH